MRNVYIESNIEEGNDMKTKFKFRNLTCPQGNSDAVCKSYVCSGMNDPGIIRNTAQVDFNDKNLDNVRFVKVNSLPAVREHLTQNFTSMKLFLITWLNHHC